MATPTKRCDAVWLQEATKSGHLRCLALYRLLIAVMGFNHMRLPRQWYIYIYIYIYIYSRKHLQKSVGNMQHSHGMHNCKWLVGGVCLKTLYTRPPEVEVVEVATVGWQKGKRHGDGTGSRCALHTRGTNVECRERAIVVIHIHLRV